MCDISEFEENEKKVCVLCSQLFAILHSHTQLTNHHTEVIQSYHFQTIIPSSYQNHTILEIYIYRLFERRAFDLSRPRALRAPGSEYFLRQSLASTASFSDLLQKFLVIIAGKNSRERKKRRDTKKQREKNLSLERERL